jgi:bifunctional non-homologous end joining protein LigD
MATTLRLSHLDKCLFPECEVTKGDLIDHYRRVAPRALPYLRDRPAAVMRYPDGIDGASLFQQAAPADTPSWIEQVTVPEDDGATMVTHLLCQDEQTLVYLADQDAVTLHTWLSRADPPGRLDRLDQPDQVLFDLDPSHDFDEARQAALDLRELLCELGLPSLVKTTGGRGLHVSVPIERRYHADELRDFARTVCTVLESREPERYTSEVRRAKPAGRMFLDISRNAYGQAAVAPYSVRATQDARVATPLAWHELEDDALTPARFTVSTMPQRLAEADPWGEPPVPAATLETARQRIGDLPV